MSLWSRLSTASLWSRSAAPRRARRYARNVTAEELANLAHLRRARDLMDREYARPLDVAALARAALMSSAHFSRQFRAAYGETPYTYLMTRRIERAKALLRHGDLSITEVCLAVGCTSLGSFSARFTEVVGQPPTAYRARDHSALASVPGCLARDLTRPTGKPASRPSASGTAAERDRRGARGTGSGDEQDRRSARVAGSLVLVP
jgi:AraC-like DNA-binding protein